MSAERYRVGVSSSDGDGVSDCDATDTLLRGALRNGVALSYECNSGGCGSCKFDLLEGEVENLWPEAPGLSPRDRRKGRLLACQCRPISDCRIKARVEASAPPIRPSRREVAFAGCKALTPDMAEFRFVSEGAADFLPGQFAMLSLPGIDGERAYSMSNTANEDGQWRFIIKRMPGGKGTGFLFDRLGTGDRIGLDGPYGNAWLRQDNERDIVLIAGGSGLSPVVSIVRAITSSERFSGRKVYFFYGGRGPQDICTERILKTLEPSGVELICHTAVSDAALAREAGWEGPRCFVHELVEQTLGDRMPEFEFYFCGPPPMTEAVQRMAMIDYRVPFDQLHFDRFF